MSIFSKGEQGWRQTRRAVLRIAASLAPGRGEQELANELAGATDAELEAARDARGWPWIAALRQDAAYALRRMRRQPGFSLVVIVTLALGIGANTAIFSLWNGLMLRPLPVRDPQSLLLLQWQSRHLPHFTEIRTSGDCQTAFAPGAARGCNFSVPYFQDLRAAGVFSGLAAYRGGGRLDFTWNGQPRAVQNQLVSGNYFSVLGVNAAIGRLLTPGDDQPQAPAVAVLSYRFWRETLGASPAVIGADIALNGEQAQVVGVAEYGFDSLGPGKSQDVWTPLALESRFEFSRQSVTASPRFAIVTLVGRLAPGVGLAPATAAAATLWTRSMLAGPKPMLRPDDAPAVTLTPAGEAFTGSRSIYAQPLLLLMAAVGLILLLVCVNVAGLLLARGAARAQEIALRRALGASRGRIFRQLLTEALVLSGAGAVAGLFLAYGCARGIAAAVAASASEPLPAPSLWDHRVLGFTLALTVFTGLACGVWPARSAARAANGVRQGRRAFAWATAQVALSTTILVCTALLVRTLQRVEAADLGFNPAHLITFGVNPGGLGFTGAARDALYRQLRERLRGLPGVQAAGTSMAPLLSSTLADGFSARILHDRDGRGLVVNELQVGPGFLEALGLPLLAGRGFADADLSLPDSQPQPAIVSQRLAQALFGNINPVGRTFGATTTGPRHTPGNLIVGEVGDAKFASVRAPVAPAIYIPYEGATAYFTLQATAGLAPLLPLIRQTVAGVNRNLPVFDVRSEADNVVQLTFQERMLASLTGGLGILALLLACLGLYGILAHDAVRRQREWGVRMALGASPTELARGVIGRGIFVALTGLAIGCLAAWPCTQALRSFLYDVAPSDWLAWAAAAGLLLVFGTLASLPPARRVLASDPAQVLRAE